MSEYEPLNTVARIHAERRRRDLAENRGKETASLTSLGDEQKGRLIRNGLLMAGALGASVGVMATESGHNDSSTQTNVTPIEQQGDHHGSTGIRSVQHLKQFSAEHGITINKQK